MGSILREAEEQKEQVQGEGRDEATLKKGRQRGKEKQDRDNERKRATQGKGREEGKIKKRGVKWETRESLEKWF